MDSIVLIVVAVLAGSWLVNLLCVLYFVRVPLRAKPIDVADEQLGKFCVGMPLRGADPHLCSAIRSILAQDYPEFELHIVVDSRDDPAWALAAKTIRELAADNVTMAPLEQRRKTCSLYASSLAQFVDGLDDSCQFLAFADADMIVPPTWLRNMAAALADPKIGGTLGNRWYLPPSGQWGTLVRHLWNLGAVYLMWALQIPWTGALSLRRQDALRIGLADKLKHGLTEDVPMKKALGQLGLRMKFVPQSIIPNREEIELPRCFEFIGRQTFLARLYHPAWWGVVLYTVATSTMILGPWIVAAGLQSTGNWQAAAGVAAAGLVYVVGIWSVGMILDGGVRRLLAERGEALPAFPVTRKLKLLLAVPVTQTLFLVAALGCINKRRMSWRGVTYQIRGPWDIEVLDDQTSTAQASPGENVSL